MKQTLNTNHQIKIQPLVLFAIIVAGLLFGQIRHADNSLTYVFQWGSLGAGIGHFSNPEGIAIDSSNNVYVADSFNDRIEKFDSNGNYLAQWGNSGTGNGQFNDPWGVAPRI